MNKFSFLEQSIARACEGRDRSMKWIMGGCQGLTSSSFEDRYCVAYLSYFCVFFVMPNIQRENFIQLFTKKSKG